MEVTKVDIARAENVIRALKRGKFEVEGEEILAFAQSFAWLGELIGRVQAALAPKVEPPPAADQSTVKPRGRKS